MECGYCERDLRGGHAPDCPKHELLKLRKLADLAESFYNDVMPQVGSLALQDYETLNALGSALAERRNANAGA